MRKDLLKGLTPEQIERVKKCKSPEELLVLAKAEGVELTSEQLEVVSGGGKCQTTPEAECKRCGSKDIKIKRQSTGVLFDYQFECTCRNCGNIFYIF